jgi:hypothetical protein
MSFEAFLAWDYEGGLVEWVGGEVVVHDMPRHEHQNVTLRGALAPAECHTPPPESNERMPGGTEGAAPPPLRRKQQGVRVERTG